MKESKKLKKKNKKGKINKSKVWNIWKTDIDLKLPEKRFFQKSINSMKSLKKKEFDVLVDYKGSGFYMINKILIFKKLPLVIKYDTYNMKYLFNNKKKGKLGKEDKIGINKAQKKRINWRKKITN